MIFFDGVCNLCNRLVDYVIRRDRAGRFHFASLQGETARSRVPEFAAESGLSTVALATEAGVFTRSEAIGRILRGLGGGSGWLGRALLAIPRPLREWGYRVVAARRYRWFGRREVCRLPSPEERGRFLP